MTILTLTSDYGYQDHYAAAVKAKILSRLPGTPIADVSHGVTKYNIAHAGFILRSVFRDFPKGTIHLVAVGKPGKNEEPRFLAFELEGHFFLTPDNGLIALLSRDRKNKPFLIPCCENRGMSFPLREALGNAALKLLSGKKLADIGEPTDTYIERFFKSPGLADDSIMGNVLRVDDYGNLITNISRTEFETLRDERSFSIGFARETLRKLSKGYHDTAPGDCTAFFNNLDLLEIAVNEGSAAQLLGINFDSQVVVSFFRSEPPA